MKWREEHVYRGDEVDERENERVEVQVTTKER